MSEVNDEFRIDSPEGAAWAMRKYRRLAQRKEQNDRLAQAERNRIDLWLERVNERVEGEMDFFHRHLEAYAMSQRAQGRKSIDLPDGVVKTRSQSATVAVDKSTFVQWALEAKRDDLLRVSYAPDVDAIKSTTVVDGGHVVDVASGEVLPGVQPVPERVSVSIAPDLDAIDLEGMEDDTDE